MWRKIPAISLEKLAFHGSLFDLIFVLRILMLARISEALSDGMCLIGIPKAAT